MSVRVSRSLFSLRRYLLFFALVSFLVTCCFLLFFRELQASLGEEWGAEALRHAAKITFANVLFLSFLCALIDGIRRKVTVEHPVRRILEATQRLTRGDFSARIQPFHGLDGMNEFDAIINDFNKMAAELSGIETLRTDFVANVSHELKTPLAVIQNYAVMLQDPGLPAAQRAEYGGASTPAARRGWVVLTAMLGRTQREKRQVYPRPERWELSEQTPRVSVGF